MYMFQFHTWCKILQEEEGDKEKVEVASDDINSDNDSDNEDRDIQLIL